MHMFAESLSKEQDKGEITIKTVKEINKQYQYKEAIVIIALLIFLLVLYRIQEVYKMLDKIKDLLKKIKNGMGIKLINKGHK